MVGKARKRGVGARRAARAQPEEEEDEEQGPPPSPGDPSYFQDQVDAFHEARARAALWSDGESGAEDAEEEEEEEEVLGLDLREEEEEEDEDEDEDEDDDADSVGGSSVLSDPDPADAADPSLSWGRRKNLYYDTDSRASKGRGRQSQQEAEEEEREEEEEAQRIQRRLAQALQEDDVGLSWVQAFGQAAPALPEDADTRVVKDLDRVSSKEKLQMLRRESPELLELIEDLKAKLTEAKDELEPLLRLAEKGIIPPGKGRRYLSTKYSLYLNYCANISFYLVLKARRAPIHGHPVIERLVTYRSLINELAQVDQRLSQQVRALLSHGGKVPADLKKKARKPGPKDLSKLPEVAEDSDLDEEAALKHYKEMEERLKLKRKLEETEGGEEEAVEDPNAKRAITYQIAKNKGLTPRRKKIDRNPRVKHREKFRRAKIRRKGQVPQVRTEEYKYSGELSGIRAGVKKSIKLK